MCNYIFVQNKKKKLYPKQSGCCIYILFVITSSRKPKFICLNYNISVHPV